MEEALIKRLIDAPEMYRVIGRDVYWGIAPEGSKAPYLIIQLAARNREYTHDGAADLQYPRIQFDVYARTKADAAKVSRLLLNELERRKVVAGVVFEDAILVYESDGDASASEGGRKTFRTTMDFLVPHRPQ